MKALVTGGGGFLGQYIVERLISRGDSVRSFSRRHYPELEKLGVELVRGDLCNEKDVVAACEGIDTVFHTAALPGIQCRWEPFYRTNVLGTHFIIKGCVKHGVRRLVFTGSPSCVFNGTSQENVDETTPYPVKWLAHYPHSKALAEKAVLEANATPLPHTDEKLLTCSLRPHLIWGPRDQHLVPRLIRRAKKGFLFFVGTGKNLVDHTYVENAAIAHIQAADTLVSDGYAHRDNVQSGTQKSRVAGKAYFISQGKPINCLDWINEILAFANLAPVKRGVPFSIAWNVGAALEFVYKVFGLSGEPIISRFLAAELAYHHYFNISAAKNDFGYRPEISTEEGMKRLKEHLLVSNEIGIS